MIFRLTILLPAFFSMFCVGILAAPSKNKAMQELRKVTTYQEGAKAMADQLPDLAIRHFRATLADKSLSENARPFTTLALAEALIRSSTSAQGRDQQATEALTLLSSDSVKDIPATPIWKAEALAALGRYQDAEATLAAIDQKHPRHRDAQLIRAHILLALNRTEHALTLLESLAASKQSKSSDISNEAKLLSAEIHIKQRSYDKALQLLDRVDSQNPSAAQLREYLLAKLSLAENKAADAINRFRSLVTEPNHISQRIYHACVLGLADALAANKQSEEAIATLEDYISKHPNSSILQPIFQRLAQLLPADLPNDHPSMQKLHDWSGAPPPRSNTLYITGDTADAIPTYQSAPSEYDDLVALSLHLRAQLLAQSSDANQQLQALSLLTRLRSLHPAHTLPPSELYLQIASASLLDTANIQLKQKQTEQAAFTLAAMEKVAFSPQLKDQASFLLGLLMIKETQYEDALAAFRFAQASTTAEIANAATINTGISALLASDLAAFEHVIGAAKNNAIKTALELERSLWKCRKLDPSGRVELESFIMNHLGHARENEARLALAASSVDIMPADIILAKAQLDIISPRLNDATSQYGITRVRIRAEELSQNWSEAAAAAEGFIREFPTDPRIPGIMLKQGEAYYHNEDFNQARRIFQTINDQFPESPFTPYAKFYTAMAARLGGTTQAREESVKLFQTIIDEKLPLSAEARIQQSRVLIDLRRYSEAEKSLLPLVRSKQTSLSQHRDAGVLMADCYHRQASSNPEKYAPAKYELAVAIYDRLLEQKHLPLSWNNRLHFLRGQTLESMGEQPKALDSYYSVIIQTHAPTNQHGHDVEWFWFYRCGFKALSILEADQRWEAAVKLARRIASFDGPRAEEASKRANNLAKTHMIWEEETPPQAIEIPSDEP